MKYLLARLLYFVGRILTNLGWECIGAGLHINVILVSRLKMSEKDETRYMKAIGAHRT